MTDGNKPIVPLNSALPAARRQEFPWLENRRFETASITNRKPSDGRGNWAAEFPVPDILGEDYCLKIIEEKNKQASEFGIKIHNTDHRHKKDEYIVRWYFLEQVDWALFSISCLGRRKGFHQHSVRFEEADSDMYRKAWLAAAQELLDEANVNYFHRPYKDLHDFVFEDLLEYQTFVYMDNERLIERHVRGTQKITFAQASAERRKIIFGLRLTMFSFCSNQSRTNSGRQK